MKRGRKGTMALVVFVLFSLGTLDAGALDSEENKNIQIIDKLPLTLTPLDLEKRQKYNALLTNGRAFNQFRLSLTHRVVSIRARVTPKPPFDPDFPSWFHGVSFAFKGQKQSGWAVPAALIQDADLLQFKNVQGDWKDLALPDVCEGAELVIIQSPKLKITAMEDDPLIEGKALSPAQAIQVQVNTPLFALNNTEGAYPTLDHGSIRSRGVGDLKNAWNTELKLPPGTPLVNSDGEVLVIRISRGTAHYELTPERALRCKAQPKQAVIEQESPEL